MIVLLLMVTNRLFVLINLVESVIYISTIIADAVRFCVFVIA
jgi:hypothetical protein